MPAKAEFPVSLRLTFKLCDIRHEFEEVAAIYHLIDKITCCDVSLEFRRLFWLELLAGSFNVLERG